MNLYILDLDPAKAAQCLGDKHLSRAIVECTQMLVNCFPQELLEQAPRTAKDTVRHHAYEDEYCAMWTRRRVPNAVWVLQHAIACEVERHYRFPHVFDHPCVLFLRWASENTRFMEFSEVDTARRLGQTPFVKNVPFCYRRIKDPVLAYRAFYRYEKTNVHQWTRRKTPDWITDMTPHQDYTYLYPETR
jgi:hypothetical protein